MPSVTARLADPRPLVIAHRGCWREPAENSLAAIKACAALGVDMVEIDLRTTKDGGIVLLHDESLDRTTTLRGALRDLPLNEVRKARLRRGMGGVDAAVTDQRIPTFEEVLAAPLDRTFIFLDIKEPIHEAVFRLIQKHHAEDRVLFSINRGFGPELMHASFVGKAALMPKFDQYENGACNPAADPATDFARYAALKAGMYEAVFCDDRFLVRVHELANSARLWVNTLGPQFAAGREEDKALANPDMIWGDLIRHGVSAFQTDHPTELIDYLRRTGRR